MKTFCTVEFPCCLRLFQTIRPKFLFCDRHVEDEPLVKPLRGSLPAVSDEHEIKEVLRENEDLLWWRAERELIDKRIREGQ